MNYKESDGIYRASLRDWELLVNPYFHVKGKVYNDKNGVFEDGTVVFTSAIDKVDVLHALVYTKNSIYKLETD